MRSPLLRSVAAAVLVLSVSGCGGGPDVSAPDPTTSAGPAEPTGPTSGITTPPSEGLQKVRVVGEVVEVGDCVVVRDDNDITWTIAAGPAVDLVRGDRVQVTGVPDLSGTGCGGPVVTATRVTVLD